MSFFAPQTAEDNSGITPTLYFMNLPALRNWSNIFFVFWPINENVVDGDVRARTVGNWKNDGVTNAQHAHNPNTPTVLAILHYVCMFY